METFPTPKKTKKNSVNTSYRFEILEDQAADESDIITTGVNRVKAAGGSVL